MQVFYINAHCSSHPLTHRVWVLVEEAPLVQDHEDQPAKYADEEQNLGHKLQHNVDVPLEVPKFTR